MLKITAFAVLLLTLQAFSIRQFAGRESSAKITYPIRLAYIDRSTAWYGDKIAAGLGVPGYAQPHDYNFILLAFWSCAGAPKDMAMIWASAMTYFAQGNSFGNNTQEIQKALKKIYNAHGIKVLISAFGDSEFPTSAGEDPVACGHKLGQFVKENNLDGADIDWEDNTAMSKGTGEDWLIKFTKAVREEIPDHILSHAPQAPYFKKEYYTNGAYITVNKEVGHMIDFYMIQFYNQVQTQYSTYEELFIKATGPYFNGTSVKQIAARGVPLKKLVVGKPILPSDASNTGWVNQTHLGQWSLKAFEELKWYAGIGHWQYPSDLTGQAIVDSTGKLKEKCTETKTCK